MSKRGSEVSSVTAAPPASICAARGRATGFWVSTARSSGELLLEELELLDWAKAAGVKSAVRASAKARERGSTVRVGRTASSVGKRGDEWKGQALDVLHRLSSGAAV